MPDQNLRELVSVRVTPDVKEQLLKMAEQERRSLSLMTNILLEESLAARVPVKKRKVS